MRSAGSRSDVAPSAPRSQRGDPSRRITGAPAVWTMGGAVAVAIAGSLLHNAREFGAESVLAGSNGELVLIVPMLAAFAAWWFVAGARTPAAWTLVALALLNLIGGAVLTVLPLGLLPFEPEQSRDHYLSHIIYGAAQLPLLALGIREATTRTR
jgi:hypothetical protein